MSELRVASVRVRDVLGVKEASIEPGRITILKGRNGSSKSSILAAVQAALGRGSLAKLARVGKGEKDDPEVVLMLEGPGAEAYQVRRAGEKVVVKARVGQTAAFEDVPRPQEFLTGLFDPVGSNPVRFLQAPDKERVLLFLEALTLKYDRVALLAEMGITASELTPIPAGLHPLEEIGMIHDQVYTRRTGVNRDEKAAAQSADQLRRNVPASMPEDHAAAIAALDGEVGTLAQDLGARESAAKATHAAAVAKADTEHLAEEAKVDAAFKEHVRSSRARHEQWAALQRAEVEAAIAKAATQVQEQIDARRSTDEAHLVENDTARGVATQQADAALAVGNESLAALRNTLGAKREQLAALREQARAAEGLRALDEQARKFDAQRDGMKAESQRLTAAIEALDAHRRRLAEDLPIAGLSIEGREIRVNGIPFDQINTAAKVEIAVKVACLRAKSSRLPVVFVDGAEALDQQHFDLLVAELRRQDVQAFLARVEEGDLAVETEHADATA